MKVIPVIKRFWNYVNKTDYCWLWTGYKNPRGYGGLRIGARGKSKCIRSHRLSWEIHFGKIPKDMSVLHKCDNTSCVRPEHLFLGTQGDNMRDMSRKHRQFFQTHPNETMRGEKNGMAILTEDKVRQIRNRYKTEKVIAKIAKEFSCSRRTVNDVVNFRTWKHII
jgi:hypothetical protein